MPMTLQVDLVWYEAAARINFQRVDSAVSKIGVISNKASKQTKAKQGRAIVDLVCVMTH